MVRQPTRFSCLSTCLAFLCDLDQNEYFDRIGHNCSEKPASEESAFVWINLHGFTIRSYTSIDKHNEHLITQALTELETPAVLRVNKNSEHDHAVIVYPTPVGLKVIDPVDSGTYYLHEFKYPISGLYLVGEEETDANDETNKTLHSQLNRLCQV